jgi:flagellin-like protein
MNLNKKLKLRKDKAVSSVIGVILMVAIAVALASTVYIYMAGMINVNPQVRPSVRFIQDNSKYQLQVFSASPENINWEDFTISWKISGVVAYLNPGNELLTNGGGMPSQPVRAGQLINFNGPTDDVIIRHSPTNTLMGMWSFPGTSGSSGDDGGDDDEPVEYTLSVSMVGSGGVSKNPDQSTYSPGDSVDLTANADSGWSFSGWSGDLSGSDNPATITMNDDMNIEATFTENPPIEYTLSVSVAGSGSVTKDPDQSTYSPGDSVDLTATANSGWSFSGWSGDLSGSDNPATITMNDDMNIEATFTENPPVEVDLLIDDFESGNLNKWDTNWDLINGFYGGLYTSPYHSVECSGNDDDLISNDLNTAGALSITISFRYRIDEIDWDDDVYVQYYDGSHYDNIEEIGDDSENTWLTYSDTITNTGADAQYFISNFRLKIEGSSIDSDWWSDEHLWIDDVSITMTIIP